ncbi:uncharacterized protein LOC130742661 [Lotus japonicus]|uniref:uncharacterized protein LOC130742661 n=1 Tax=Lotus japonicus TaxID=34305 RepID=UPI00258EF22D|nr:uncharacterized protein LOC130742661 [Lotus japonicus]
MASCNESTLYIAENIAVEQLVILSLDLGAETYTLLSPPKGFDEVPCVEPSIGVLMDNLCFSHDLKRTHFVIWHMKEFGDVESWVQLLKISYQDLDWEPLDEYVFVTYQLFPLCLYNGDTLVLGSFRDDQAILYDKRANTVERTTLTTKSNNILLLSDYVESLVARIGGVFTISTPDNDIAIESIFNNTTLMSAMVQASIHGILVEINFFLCS